MTQRSICHQLTAYVTLVCAIALGTVVAVGVYSDGSTTTLVVVSALALLAMAGLIYLRLRHLTARLTEFEKVATRLLDGDFETRVPVHSTDEIDRIGVAFNRVLDEMTALFATFQEQTCELERSNAELEQFAYVASHDLQEPLRKVASFCQLLQQRYAAKLDSDAERFIGYAVDGATRMKHLVMDLLNYSRVGRSLESLEPVDADNACEVAIDNLGCAIEESDAVVTHEPLPTIMADHAQLVQLFQNLVGNALKYRSEQRPEIHVGVQRQEADWIFSVSDNGIGIPADSHERVFLIFQRLHGRNEYSGTGIGLAVCKKIVEHLGGQIWFNSEPDVGSTFHFTIPVAIANIGDTDEQSDSHESEPDRSEQPVGAVH